MAIRSSKWSPEEPLQAVVDADRSDAARALGRRSGVRRGGQRRAALRRLASDASMRSDASYEIIVVDDGSRDETYRTPGPARGRRPRVEARQAPPQLRPDRGDGGRASTTRAASVIVPMDGDLQNDPADIARCSRRSTRATTSSAAGGKNRQDSFMRRLPVAHRELADRPRHRRAAPRLRLHAQGVPRRGRRGDAALRRDAPLPPRARVPGGRADHRDPRQPPPARLGPEQVRARPDVQGAARPADREVPVRLVDEAELRLRRQRRRSCASSGTAFVAVDGVPEARQRRLRLPAAVAARGRLPVHDRVQPDPAGPARGADRPHVPRVAVEAGLPRARAAQLRRGSAAT